jgi:hypothetical protein
MEPMFFLRYSSAGRCYKFNCDDTVDDNKKLYVQSRLQEN